MSQFSREEWAKLLRRTCFGLGDTEPSGWCPITDQDHGYYLKMADAVLAKLPELEKGCTIASDWVSEKEAREKIAQAELAAYKKALGAIQQYGNQLSINALERFVLNWHVQNDPPKCGHPPIKQAARDTQFTSDVYCECGARRKRDWGGDWESPDAKA
jgi:hypothetical protein